MIRETIFFSGRVQGVGFRYAANEIAKNLKVTGTVENLDDGRVRIIVEGRSPTIDQFVESIRIWSSGKLKTIDRFQSEASLQFDGFKIVR